MTPARLLSTGILGLACLGFATLQISHQATSSVNLKASPANVAVVPKQWKGPGVPRIVKVPAAPIVKIPVAPIAPKSAP